MTGLAFGCQRGVHTVERKARVGAVIESFEVERPQFSIHPGVLDMTRDAAVRRVTMDALALRDPLGHWLVTRQAFLGSDAASGGVALQTAADAFERRVGAAQASWRHQRAKLCVRIPRPDAAHHERHQQNTPRRRRTSAPHSLRLSEARIAEIQRDPHMECDDDEERVDERTMEDMPEPEQVPRPLQVRQTTGEHRSLGGAIDHCGDR